MLLARRLHRRFKHHSTGCVGDAADKQWIDLQAPIGQHCVGPGKLQRVGGAGAQGLGQVVGLALGVKSKAAGPGACTLGAQQLHQPDGHQVFGAGQRGAQGDGAIGAAIVVLRVPGAHVFHGCVVDQCVGLHTGLDSPGVHKGLVARARLAPALSDVVELVAVEIKTSHQGAHFAVVRVQRHKGTFSLRPLGHRPVFALLQHAHHRTALDTQAACGFVRQRGLHLAQAQAFGLDALAIGQHQAHAFGGHAGHDGQTQGVIIVIVGEHVRHARLGIGQVSGQGFIPFGPAPGLTQLMLHQRAAQGGVGSLLFGCAQGSDHAQARGVS